MKNNHKNKLNILKKLAFSAFIVLGFAFMQIPNANAAQLMVTTNPAYDVASASATLSGYIDLGSLYSADTWFEYSTNPNFLSGNTMRWSVISSSTVTADLSYLNQNTLYYFRACAISFGQGSKVCGSVKSFSTGTFQQTQTSTIQAPSVTTRLAYDLSQNSARLDGSWVSNDTSATTWFEYATNQTTVSNGAGISTNQVNQNGSSGSMNEMVYNLQPNTTYYFRAVIRNTQTTSYGSILSFNTNQNTVTVQNIPSVNTNQATGIASNTAILNGYVNSVNSSNVWFQYGLNSNALSFGTSLKPMNGSAYANEMISNLVPGTTYYFRVCALNSAGQNCGTIFSFITQSQAYVNPNPVVLTQTTPTVVYVETPSVPAASSNPEPVSNNTATSSSKYISVKVENRSENVSAGDNIEYVVTYKNISSKKITDAVLRITMPKDVSFDKTSDGSYSDSDNAVTLKIDKLDAGETGKLTISGSVARGVKDGDVLTMTTVIVYPNPTSNIKENVMAYSLNKIVAKSGTSLTAASIFGDGSFLPTTLVGWLVLIAGIFALIYFGRKFYAQSQAPEPAKK